MAKNLKLNIKNAQIAEAINLSGLKSRIAKKKKPTEEEATKAQDVPSQPIDATKELPAKEEGEESPRIRARSHSAFAEHAAEPVIEEIKQPTPVMPESEPESAAQEEVKVEKVEEPPVVETKPIVREKPEVRQPPAPRHPMRLPERPPQRQELRLSRPQERTYVTPPQQERIKLGPTGRHINDLLPPKRPTPAPAGKGGPPQRPVQKAGAPGDKTRPKTESTTSDDKKNFKPAAKFKEYRDVKPTRKLETVRSFDGRDRQGLRESEDDQGWRKKRHAKLRYEQEDLTIRPSSLKVRVPISIKDLASEMKLKASQLVTKLFMQGTVVTLNDLLDDETTIQLLGQEFGCEIIIDTTEEERIRITDKSIKEEIAENDPSELKLRPPVVAFMGHVDHGKTSLIDAIRKSNLASQEAGDITQHIGAFRCHTDIGDIAILDTPGHEAFSAMRARGADVTDIVVLVVAGDEGLRQQTLEAIQHAKAAGVTIVVAINKCDKPNFNAENVYRQLAEQELLPEAWGGQTITINCSAVTREGIDQLLEMLAIQAEVLELRANPQTRARGTVLESEMHKGLGAVATVLVQTGTLKPGDSLVFADLWGRVKTMRDDLGKDLPFAEASTPVEITGLSGLPEAGQEFIAVKNEKEAREIAEARMQGKKQGQQKKKLSMESLFQQAKDSSKKILNLVLRADVQGSLEALKVALEKISADKVDLNVIFSGVGEISESDVQLAAASKAVIIGFHTQVESHADSLIKQLSVQVRLHDIIYHAIDDAKLLMSGLLEKIAQETEKGKAEVQATFKSSQLGLIAGCIVSEGSIHRNHQVRLRRGNEIVWKGTISSLKRIKEDVREVQKGLECGILLNNSPDVQEGDIIEAYEITFITQEL